MKTLYATRTLQKNRLYKEIEDNKKFYYQLSIEKEQKQKSYLKRLKVFNSNDEINMSYEWEKKYKEYSHLTTQKISTIEAMSKEKGYVPLFITITVPSSYHPFKSISYRNGKRLYTRVNPDFKFDTVNEAIRESYLFLNSLFKIMYKRIKHFTKKEIMYVKSIESHTTLIPHLHCLIFVPIHYVDSVRGVYKRILEYYNLQRADLETVSIKDDINYASRYILKYITKTLSSGSDYYEARILDGWKRANKIRLLSHSLLPLNQQIYKKIYYSFTNIKKNKIFSKKEYKLETGKKEMDKQVATEGIPIYYFFQQNSFLEQRIYEAGSKCSKTKKSKLSKLNSLFHIKLDVERSRDLKGRLTYKVCRLIIQYRGIEIYQHKKLKIIKDLYVTGE